MTKSSRCRVRSKPVSSDTVSILNFDDDLDEFIELHEQSIPIDEDDLNACIVEQTASYYEVSKRLALEVSRRDAAKLFLKETEALVDIELRDDARKTSTKMTETELASRRQTHDDMREAENVLQRCQQRVRALEALDKSFSQRAFVIRDLCQLWIASYYGDKSDAVASDPIRSVQAERNKKVLNKLRS